MSKPEPETKKCSRCGAAFSCLHSASCWCTAYIIAPEKAEEMRNKYSDCLCRECLQLYTEPSSPAPDDDLPC